MKPKIFVIFFYCLAKYYALAQNNFYTSSDRIFDSAPNFCKPLNQLLSVSKCENDSKGWCILIDNRNRGYDGNAVVELVHTFNRGNLYPGEIQTGSISSNLKFKVVPGINSWSVTVYQPEVTSKISSIKINNNEICRFNTSLQRNGIEEPTNGNIPVTSLFEDNSNSYYADCARRTGYTQNSMRYCPNYKQEFMIEKRFMRNGELYWCIIINNHNNSLTSANHLQIVYSAPYQYIHSPKGAYIGHSEPSNEFHLGSPQTIIAISKYRNELANLTSITIDNQPICNYFEPHALPSFKLEAPPMRMIAHKPVFQQQQNPIGSFNPLIQSPVKKQRIVKPTGSTKKCGMKPINKIAFGTNTKPGDWPWHATIYKLKTRKDRMLICGGTLIGHKTIITAAHCAIENRRLVVSPDRLIVELGRYDRREMTSMAIQELRVYDVVLHEQYRPDSFGNDIAILVLATYVQITQYVNVICLPQPHEKFENRMGTTVGWGLDQTNQYPTKLKEMTLPVVTDVICLNSNRAFFGEYLTEGNFCAGYINKTNLCHGDGGGGLVFNTNGQWVLGGVTSLGVLSKTTEYPCDQTQYALFTNVAKYLPWIKENSGDDY